MFEQNPSKWTPEFFDRMRQMGDPYADKVIASVYAESQLPAVNKLLASLIRNDQPVSEELPEKVRQFFEETAVLPPWADKDLIRIGEGLFAEYSLIAFSILGCASLPECYSGAIGAKVLNLTGQLEDHINRRIVETFFMVVYALTKGGLGPKGQGIRTTQKVRMMHASIRHLIMSEETVPATTSRFFSFAVLLCNTRWNTKTHGYPINQETMGLTYLTFSYVILRSLNKLGVTIEKERENAYFHTWNVIGHILGVDETFFCNNMQDAETLWNLILPRLQQASPEGTRLTDVLMRYMGDQIKQSSFMGKVMPYRHIPKWLTRELVGEETADLLGIQWGFGDKVGMWLTAACIHALGITEKDIYGGLKFGHKVAEWVFRKLAKAEHTRIGDRPSFVIPDQLRQQLEE